MFPGVLRRGSHSDGPRLPTDAAVAARIPDRAGGRHRRDGRKAPLCRRRHCIYGGLAVAVAAVFSLGIWQQQSMVGAGGDSLVGLGNRREEPPAVRRPAGSTLRYVLSPAILRKFQEQNHLELARSERGDAGLRPPRLALVAGTMNIGPQSLMLLTLAKGLSELGYRFTVFTFEDGEARYLWENIGFKISFVGQENEESIDWSNYDGVILNSLEGKRVISSLMQEPFVSVPLIWLIHEDILGKRLEYYAQRGLQYLINQWKSAFNRADVVVFPDYSLPMLYTSLNNENFWVISCSPVCVWAPTCYTSSYSRDNLRKEYGYTKGDIIIVVIGSYYFYDELPWDYAAAMHALAPQISKLTKSKSVPVHFVYLCGNSTDVYHSAFQDLAMHMGISDSSIKHYPMDHRANSLLLIANIVLYGSFQEEPSFPPLLLRAMTFEVPVLAPNLTIIKKYVTDGVHGLLFDPNDPGTLAKAFSLLIGENKLSKLASSVAFRSRLRSRNMLAYDCIISHAKLLENVLQYPSDTVLPGSVSHIRQNVWLWNLFDKYLQEKGCGQNEHYLSKNHSGVVDFLETQLHENLKENSLNKTDSSIYDYPIQLDWDDLSEIEISEDIDRREMQELEERTEKTSASWEDVYRTARKSEKLKFEENERDEGELERTGQPVCIYEIYSGEGAWPFLHHRSMYRGITLSKRARRPSSDDVDAVGRLRLLLETHYKDLLCEFGAMFAVANRIDSMHKLPWIGFQSWRTTGRKVSLSERAEESLEEIIMAENKDVIYYWVQMDQKFERETNLDFWSTCDRLNAGHCSALFEGAFRQMYGIPDEIGGLPPMPDDGDYWSILHSWVMPTPSFLEFMMFSRMFADAVDSLSYDHSNPAACLLGSSNLEKKHCYCRIMEVLVNVWAYHSGRRMVYLNPITGELKEQHPLMEREEMWVKYFNFTLLKSMDEDLAEEADDNMHASTRWLWPLTGEVHWRGRFEKEREERYRMKADKKRKTKEKLLERQKSGYRQKPLG